MAETVPTKTPELKPRKKIRANSKKTAQEKADLLKHFAAAMDGGLGATKAAKSLNTTLRTIYRIDRQREGIQTTIIEATPEIGPSISDAIKILCTTAVDIHVYREALYKLIVWMKWPSNPIYHFSAVTNCVIAYAHKSTGVACIADLDLDNREYLSRYIRLDVLSRMCSPDAIEFPYFKFHKIENAQYTELDVLSEICWYILASKHVSSLKHYRPSLGKAFFLLHEELFRCKWNISYTTFRHFWKTHGPSCPFLYVERYHSALDFDIDPNDAEFVHAIDALVAQRDAIRQFLANCRWAVEKMLEQIDGRALTGFDIPRFPDDLIPEGVSPPDIPSSFAKALKAYRSPSK